MLTARVDARAGRAGAGRGPRRRRRHLARRRCPPRRGRGRGSCRKRRASSAGSPWSARRCASAGSRTSTASSSRASGARRCRPRCCSPAAAARSLLAAERTALNFLGHLSGIATLTARFAEAVRGDRGDDPRHPQDDPRPARAGEGGGRGRGRPQPPDGPLRRDPDQGEPHRPRRRPRQGGPRAPAPRSPDLAVEVEVRDLEEAAYALGTGADRLLLDNMDPGDDARGGGAARRARRRRTAAVRWRPPAASPSRPSARSPRPASTSSPSAPSPTPPRTSTSASCCEPAHLSSRERRRSLSTRPPVCSSRAVVGLVLGEEDGLDRRAAARAGLALAPVDPAAASAACRAPRRRSSPRSGRSRRRARAAPRAAARPPRRPAPSPS